MGREKTKNKKNDYNIKIFGDENNSEQKNMMKTNINI